MYLCFNNPLKEYGITFLYDILIPKKRRIAIPISSIIGAYHIATRYLKVSSFSIKKFGKLISYKIISILSTNYY
jgi:hypothetical protein